jgi:hypothetical protein
MIGLMCCLVRVIAQLRRAAIDGCGARKTRKNSEKVPLQCHFVHHESYRKLLGIEP